MVIVPFNGVWLRYLAVTLLAAVLLGQWLGRLEEAERSRGLLLLSLVTLVFLAVYKFGLSRDPEFSFQLWNELPLQPCNAFVLLAVAASIRPGWLLKAACFYGGSLSALFGIMMPLPEFSEVGLLSPRGVGFYGFHGLALALMLAFALSGAYRPRCRDVPAALLFVAGLAALAHGINLLLRATVYPEANYFFTMGLESNPLMAALGEAIPYDFLYELPLLILVGVWCLLLIALSRLATWVAGKINGKANLLSKTGRGGALPGKE